MSALFLSIYTLFSGAQQGIITWLFREYVPASRRDWVHAALHYGGILIYLWLVFALAEANSWRGLVLLFAEAILARALLFDVSLNTSRSWFNHREGRAWGNVFEVGTTALGDRATRWLADIVGMEPEHLRFLFWLCSLLAAGCGWLLLK